MAAAARALALGLLLAVVCWGIPTHAGIAIRFDAPAYQVSEHDELTVGIVIDGDDTQAGDQPLPAGLFSFGARLTFSATDAQTRADQLDVVPALDYSGFVAGALVEEGQGFIAGRGNIILSSVASQPYRGTALFTVTLQNRAPAGRQYRLTLGSARSKVTEAVILDGKGTPLDEVVSFGTAAVTVLPDANLAPPSLRVALFPPGAIEITFDVQPGRNHFIELSSDLQTWSSLSSSPNNDGSALLPATTAGQFYRLRVVAP